MTTNWTNHCVICTMHFQYFTIWACFKVLGVEKWVDMKRVPLYILNPPKDHYYKIKGCSAPLDNNSLDNSKLLDNNNSLKAERVKRRNKGTCFCNTYLSSSLLWICYGSAVYKSACYWRIFLSWLHFGYYDLTASSSLESIAKTPSCISSKITLTRHIYRLQNLTFHLHKESGRKMRLLCSSCMRGVKSGMIKMN